MIWGLNIAGPITDNLGFRFGVQRFDEPTLQNNVGTARGAGYAQRNLYFEFQLEWHLNAFHIRNRLTHFEYDNQPGYGSFPAYNTVPLFGGLAPNPQYKYSGPGAFGFPADQC